MSERVSVEVDSFFKNSPKKRSECSLKPLGSLGQESGPMKTVWSAAQLLASAHNSRNMDRLLVVSEFGFVHQR